MGVSCNCGGQGSPFFEGEEANRDCDVICGKTQLSFICLGVANERSKTIYALIPTLPQLSPCAIARSVSVDIITCGSDPVQYAKTVGESWCNGLQLQIEKASGHEYN